MHSLLIIDDDLALTGMLKEYLEPNGFIVQVANHPLQGIETLQGGEFDVMLLDVMMPDMDGFDVLKKIRLFSSIPVIMLTAKGDDFDRILGLELGADDYLPKPFNHRELLARIKALTRRLVDVDAFGHAEILSLHNITLNIKKRSVKVAEQNIETTATEFQLLQLLMQRCGQVQTKEKLSEEVLGRRLSAYDRSLDMHVSNIRKKLSACGVQDVIQTIRGAGYLMLEPE